jgi:hypothetical protein
MATLTVKVSAAQAAYVAKQAKGRALKSAGEYISQLILMDQLKPRRAAIDALLVEGSHGPFTPLTEQDFQDIEREGLEMLAEEKRNGRQSPKKQQRSKRPA